MYNLPHLYLDNLLNEIKTSMYIKKYGHNEIPTSERQTQNFLTWKISGINRRDSCYFMKFEVDIIVIILLP